MNRAAGSQHLAVGQILADPSPIKLENTVGPPAKPQPGWRYCWARAQSVCQTVGWQLDIAIGNLGIYLDGMYMTYGEAVNVEEMSARCRP